MCDLGVTAGYGTDPGTNLIDQLLAEQQSLTAVERFSQWHAGEHAPEHATNPYRSLMPSGLPGTGEQYGFEVDLDCCTGCKACVSACHSLNGLDADEAWRDVGLLLGGRGTDAYQQTVTTACHHCADPACLNGCPVGAYEKEADTGVVRHLDDQCIGCGYCVLKCPYDVPKYHAQLGIVRKCDMCVGRLRAGEAPACVQACPTSAIRIRLVRLEDLNFTAGTTMLPGAFDSSYTQPASRYLTAKAMPRNTRPADANDMRLEHPHWPLIGMLVLTQLSVGMFTVLAVLLVLRRPVPPAATAYSATALLLAGLGVSVLHLGRPLGAWRFFLGLRTSWMSREILAFSLLAGCAMLACGAIGWGTLAVPMVLLTALLGLAAVFTSGTIYVDTRRPFWEAGLTHGKFFGSVVVLGLAACAAATSDRALIFAALVARCILIGWEQARNRQALDDDACPWQASARVLKLRLKWVRELREAVFVLTFMLSVVAMTGVAVTACVTALLVVAVTAQVLERYTFFAASMGLRMAGGYKG